MTQYRTAVGIEFLFLQPNINLLLQNLNAKQGQFDNALYGILDTRSLIRDTLIIQQNTAAGLGTAVGSTLSSVARECEANLRSSSTSWTRAYEALHLLSMTRSRAISLRQ